MKTISQLSEIERNRWRIHILEYINEVMERENGCVRTIKSLENDSRKLEEFIYWLKNSLMQCAEASIRVCFRFLEYPDIKVLHAIISNQELMDELINKIDDKFEHNELKTQSELIKRIIRKTLVDYIKKNTMFWIISRNKYILLDNLEVLKELHWWKWF